MRVRGALGLVVAVGTGVGCSSVIGDFDTVRSSSDSGALDGASNGADGSTDSTSPAEDTGTGAIDSTTSDVVGPSDGSNANDAFNGNDAPQSNDAGSDATSETGAPSDAGPDCGTLTNCNGSCVDTTTDPQACGSTCTACPQFERCVTSTCTCASPDLTCNGTCTDVTSDVHNCGACGHDCQGGACVSSQCQPVLLVPQSAISQVNDISSDGHVVVWADNGDNTIDEVDTPGGSKTVLAGTPFVNQPEYIAVSPSGNNLVGWVQYATAPGSDAGPTTTFNEVTLDMPGSGSTKGTTAGTPFGLVPDPSGARAYLEETTNGFIQAASCSFSGGCMVYKSVASGLGSYSVAYSGPWVVWADIDNHSILEFNTNNNDFVNVPNQPLAYEVAADVAHTYWITGNSQNTISFVPLGATAPVTTFVTNAVGQSFGADGTFVYYEDTSNDLVAAPLAGTASVVLAAGVSPYFNKVIGGAVYYYTSSGNPPGVPPGIYRVATPAP